MTNEEAIKWTKWCISKDKECIQKTIERGFPAGEIQETLEYYEFVLRSLQSISVPTDEPLTLDQLREMANKPYWHVGLQDDSPEPHWKILDPFVARCPEDYGYGKRWLAYAYPPAHIDREAWTAKWKRGKYSSGTHYLYCSKCGERNGKHSMFCPDCGRAMTPEAWCMLEKRLRG